MTRRVAMGVALVLLATGSTGCAGERAFGSASTIEVVSPAPMADVSLPLTVRWRADGGVKGRRFALFVDRAALSPGADFRSLARREDDRLCLKRPDCPDEEWLESRNIVLVTGGTAEVDVLPDRSTVAGTDGEFHRLTLVEVDKRGRRIGERGATVEVVYNDRDGR